MSTLKDPFEVLVVEEVLDEFEALSRKSVSPASPAAAPPDAATARFHGFDQDDCPLLVGLAVLPHEIVPARTTVPLLRSHIGSTVVLLFEDGDVRRPIVVGVLQEQRGPQADAARAPQPLVTVQADDDRLVLSAEREIVLRCGDASVTLTRAGKVIIEGRYVISNSSGYNKVKGAAVEIN
jgi:hypothetical protein